MKYNYGINTDKNNFLKSIMSFTPIRIGEQTLQRPYKKKDKQTSVLQSEY